MRQTQPSGQGHADEPMVVAVGEDLEDANLGDELMEVVGQQSAFVGVGVLHEEGIVTSDFQRKIGVGVCMERWHLR